MRSGDSDGGGVTIMAVDCEFFVQPAGCGKCCCTVVNLHVGNGVISLVRPIFFVLAKPPYSFSWESAVNTANDHVVKSHYTQSFIILLR